MGTEKQKIGKRRRGEKKGKEGGGEGERWGKVKKTGRKFKVVPKLPVKKKKKKKKVLRVSDGTTTAMGVDLREV